MNVGRFIPEIRIVKALQVADCSQSSTGAIDTNSCNFTTAKMPLYCKIDNKK